jgi:putative transposase
MRITLLAGLMLRHGKRLLELTRELPNNEYQLEDVYTRRPVVHTQAELLKRIYYSKTYTVVLGTNPTGQAAADAAAGEQPAIVDVSTLTPRERGLLDRRLMYVKAMHRKRITRGQRNRVAALIKAVAEKNGDTNPPSTSAVMAWARSYEGSNCNALALVDRHRVRKTAKRVDPQVDLILRKVLKRVYFTKDRHTLRHAYDQVRIALKKAATQREIPEDTPKISYATVQRRVNEVDLYDRIASREGHARARMVCRTAFPEGVPTYPMERVEIDHTPLNWVVICDITGLPLGRPTLTIMIDAYSSYVLGFYISFYGPGLTSVSGVVRNAILPKDDLIAGLALKHRWISHGLADIWVLDNGLEFHSFGFQTMAMTLGVDIEYCRVRTPWSKPHVERFFSNLDWLTLAKGRVRKPSANVLHIDPYTDASITFSDLVKGLMMYFVDVYPHEQNWRKLDTPFNRFQEGIERSPPATFPGSLEQFTLASGMSKVLTFSQGGIEMLGLTYGAYEFASLAKKFGTRLKLLCKWDPDDLYLLHVLHPDQRTWITAQCRWPEYAQGLSYNQHRLIRDAARKKFNEPGTQEGLMTARLRLHEFWMDATTPRRKADALLAARFAGNTSYKVLSQQGCSPVLGAPPAPANPDRLVLAPPYAYSPQEIPVFSAVSF